MENSTDYCAIRSSLEEQRFGLVSRLSALTTALTKLVGTEPHGFSCVGLPRASMRGSNSQIYAEKFESIVLSITAESDRKRTVGRRSTSPR